MINRRQFFKGAMTAASGVLIARLIPNAAAADSNKMEMSNGKTETYHIEKAHEVILACV